MVITPLSELLLSNNTLLSMWGALILHWLFPLQNSHFHPVTLWRHLAEVISEKVNKTKHSAKQQQLSGTLAFAIIYLPAFALLMLFTFAVANPAITNTVLLWFALGWKPLYDQGNKLRLYLKHAKKPAARQLLAKIVKRDTATLSSIELAKLSSEMLLTGYTRSLINVLFFYAIAGGVGAMLYTLLMQLNREWSPRLPAYKYFGKTVARALMVIEWLPSRLFALLLSLGRDFPRSIKALRTQSYQSNAEFVWSAAGSKYQIALGGSAIYDDERLERSALGGETLASATQFSHLSRALNQRSLAWIALQSLAMLAAFL